MFSLLAGRHLVAALVGSGSRLPLIVTVPAVWVGLEYFRAHFLTGFPWYFLAHTQHDFLPIIQMSDVTGAYGVSFLVAGSTPYASSCSTGSRGFGGSCAWASRAA